jgi:CO/xanthine dehydrogenase Mo-binding subunit
MASTPAPQADPTRLATWLQVLPDNTIAIRTGVSDFGQGAVGTAFRQIAAEELRVRFEAITDLVTGDTDRTPDGGISAGVMNRIVHEHFAGGVGIHPDSPFGKNGLNVQKVAAYAYGLLMDRAAAALGEPVGSLTADGGTVRGATGSVTYAELVRSAPLDMDLEVAGAASGMGVSVLGSPPLVPRSQWRVLGTSAPSPQIRAIVTAEGEEVSSVRLPGMLHGRMVHPRTLGSTLVSLGRLDPDAFPTAEVIVRGNLVGVVSPDEWEAVRAAEVLAGTTTWSDWRGLPGSDHLLEAMLETDWSLVPPGSTSTDREPVDAALASATRTVSASYAVPFHKHAPMGPETVVADVRDDGTTHVWAFSQQPHTMRQKLAAMLATDPEHVVVHFARGAAAFGRSTGGDTGAEAEAVLLSQACGRPVRLQWTREDDFRWSTQHAPYLGEVTAGLDDDGRLVGLLAEHHQPGENDVRLLGALLAGVATEPVASAPIAGHLAKVWTEWPYDGVTQHLEIARGAANIGQQESPIHVGLRHRSLRSPVHFHQNFAVESMINEAAAAAGADPIRFRLDHTTDERLIAVLEAVRRMSGWESRPSPAKEARSHGDGVVRGRGVGTTVRHGGYFAAVAEIAVDLTEATVVVDRYWLAAYVGPVVNPTALRRNLEGGTVMGISQTLLEEVRFDTSAISSADFRSYPILTMAETPEIVIEIIDDREAMSVGQAAEPPNMVPPVAITAAFFDATGAPMRRLPLRPRYVRAELDGG